MMRHIFSCIILALIVKSDQFLIPRSENNELIKCAYRIHSSVKVNHTLIMDNTLHDKDLIYFKFNDIIIYNRKSIVKFENVNIAILFINNQPEFVTHVELLRKSIRFLRVKLIVVLFAQGNLGEIFETAWKYFILDINVVTYDGIFTYFPYKEQNCGYVEYELLAKCQENIGAGKYFPDKVPKDMHGCPVRFLAYPMTPYVIDTTIDRKDDPSLVGVEVTIVDAITRRIHVTAVYVSNPHRHWGYQVSEGGTYTLMYGELYAGKVDVIFGFTYGNATYSRDFDASHWHLLDPSVWWVPAAGPLPLWRNIVTVFSPRLWLATLITVCAVALFWWLNGRNTRDGIGLVVCFLESLYVLLQGSVEEERNNGCRWMITVRMPVWLWTICSLLLFTAYQSQLVSVLTTPLYERQISSLEELVTSTLTIGIYPTVAEGFNDQNSWVQRRLLNSYVPCPLSNECINRTAFYRDYATFKNQRSGMYLMPRYFTTADGRPMLFKFSQFGILSVIRYILRRDWPLASIFNWHVIQLQSAGLIEKWDRDIARSGGRTAPSASFQYQQSEPQSLVFDHLQTAFYLLLAGYLLSLLSFFVEIIYDKFNRRGNRAAITCITDTD